MVHCVTGFLLMRLFSPWRIKFFVHRMPHIHPATNAQKEKPVYRFCQAIASISFATKPGPIHRPFARRRSGTFLCVIVHMLGDLNEIAHVDQPVSIFWIRQCDPHAKAVLKG
jgi:hypothetical protein